MRRFVVALLLLGTAAFSAAGQTGPAGEELLRRGIEHFRASRYAEAVTDLDAAAQSFLSTEQMQAYVSTGTFATLPQLETALVYLAVAQARLGKDAAARESVLRLVTAERIEPTYARLELPAEVSEFEQLAARLVPGISLRGDQQLAQSGAKPQPARPPAATPSAAPPPAVVTAPATPGTPAPLPPPVSVAAGEAERLRLIEQMVAQECARIQREADEKIAAIRAEADARIAAERTAAHREAEERIAAAERSAQERIAEIQRTADQRVAAAEAAAQRVAEQQRVAEAREPQTQTREPEAPAAPRAAPPTPAPSRRPPSPAPAIVTGDRAALLRRADELAHDGRLAEASEIYADVALAEGPREARSRAAVGLYRTGAYRRAVDAFAQLAPFRRGEEDLRYYNAVALFEVGRYDEARRELACALPFIETTNDVLRYRAKIEQMVAWQSALPATGAAQ